MDRRGPRGLRAGVHAGVERPRGDRRYEWAENGYVEAIVDWGVPVAILLFLLAGWSLALALRRLRDDPLAVGALAAIVALAVHEAADFAVEMPGVALPALALLATLFGRSGSEPSPGRRMAVGWWLVPAPLLFLVPVVFELMMPSASVEGARLAARAHDPTVPTADVVAMGESMALRHPADYFVRAVVAERLARDHDQRAIHWLNDAMYLNPTHPGPHLMAAELLASTGRKVQALVEYKLATAGAPDPRSGVFDYVAARFPAIDDLLAATPDDLRGWNALAKWLLAKNRAVDAERVYGLVVAEDPTNVRALTTLADLAIQRKDAAAAAHARVERATSRLGSGARGRASRPSRSGSSPAISTRRLRSPTAHRPARATRSRPTCTSPRRSRAPVAPRRPAPASIACNRGRSIGKKPRACTKCAPELNEARETSTNISGKWSSRSGCSALRRGKQKRKSSSHESARMTSACRTKDYIGLPG